MNSQMPFLEWTIKCGCVLSVPDLKYPTVCSKWFVFLVKIKTLIFKTCIPNSVIMWPLRIELLHNETNWAVLPVAPFEWGEIKYYRWNNTGLVEMHAFIFLDDITDESGLHSTFTFPRSAFPHRKSHFRRARRTALLHPSTICYWCLRWLSCGLVLTVIPKTALGCKNNTRLLCRGCNFV